jgi:uncharacterized protein YbbC (DUF1343 family)
MNANFVSYFLLTFLFLSSCSTQTGSTLIPTEQLIIGAERMEGYLPLLTSKRVAITANHTSLVKNTHLVDTLLASGVDVVKIFSPEHGFRGQAGAGEIVLGSIDPNTGLQVVSLYGNRKKPSQEDLMDVELMIFDIQDVGVRFYTYISTLHYVMEACAEAGIPLILLDRPNPNNYMDGPILEMTHSSFVGMHPVPLVHGMTIGEYAQLINGEGWLAKQIKCELFVFHCLNYSREMEYILPVSPSPNLRSAQAIKLYPSIALFEGTVISEGRGTEAPFEWYGHPKLTYGDLYFTPVSVPEARSPKLLGETCRGEDLSEWQPQSGTWKQVELQWLIKAYNNYPDKEKFFNDFFFKLCGTTQIYNDIRAGLSEGEIRIKWQKGLDDFSIRRAKYLIYESSGR